MLIFDLKVSRLIFQIDLRLIVGHLPIFPCFEKMLQKEEIPPDIAQTNQPAEG